MADFPTKPGLYWASVMGKPEWNAVAKLSGTAPFMDLLVLHGDSSSFVRFPLEYVRLGPAIEAPQCDLPKIEPEGYTDKMKWRNKQAGIPA